MKTLVIILVLFALTNRDFNWIDLCLILLGELCFWLYSIYQGVKDEK